jgi:hypothetical protein
MKIFLIIMMGNIKIMVKLFQKTIYQVLNYLNYYSVFDSNSSLNWSEHQKIKCIKTRNYEIFGDKQLIIRRENLSIFFNYSFDIEILEIKKKFWFSRPYVVIGKKKIYLKK